MGKSTFTGPVASGGGFYAAGANAVVNITADTTLTAAEHAGRLLTINDADCKITLPTINAGTSRELNNQGCVYRFMVQTTATDLDILTDGTDKYVGQVNTAISTTATAKDWFPGATNDVLTMNGTTTGGIIGSYVEFEAVGTAVYLVRGHLKGSGAIATPFADS
jgi:hypothetical protein